VEVKRARIRVSKDTKGGGSPLSIRPSSRPGETFIPKGGEKRPGTGRERKGKSPEDCGGKGERGDLLLFVSSRLKKGGISAGGKEKGIRVVGSGIKDGLTVST